jgi:hypothetical protein
MPVEIRASEGDDALNYTITDRYGTIYWKYSYLPDHIEWRGRGDELFVRRGDVGMKIDPYIPMTYVRSSFEATEAKIKRAKLPVTQVSGYTVTDTRPSSERKFSNGFITYEKQQPETLRERAHLPATIQNQASIEQIYGMSYSDYQRVVISAHKQQTSEHDKFLQKELDFQRAQQANAKDIRDMSMAEYAEFRKRTIGPSTHKPLEVSTNVGPVSGTDYNTHPKSPFELWKEAREKFVKGEIDDVELVLKYVREDEPGYSKIVDMEIAEERKSKEVDSGVHKHRFNWRRWPTWRWLVPWLHS